MSGRAGGVVLELDLELSGELGGLLANVSRRMSYKKSAWIS